MKGVDSTLWRMDGFFGNKVQSDISVIFVI